MARATNRNMKSTSKQSDTSKRDNQRHKIEHLRLTKLISIYKRRKRKAEAAKIEGRTSMFARATRLATATPVAYYFLVTLLSMQLYCDITGTSQASVAALETANSKQLGEPAAGASWKFLQEPRDLEAAIGQSVRLPCKVDNRDRAGTSSFHWNKNGGLISIGGDILGKHKRPGDPSYRSLPNFNASSYQEEPAIDYSLQISNLTLQDDGNYFCHIQGGDSSSTARLTVLQPPRELSISARKLNGNDPYEELPIEQRQQQQQPHYNNDVAGLVDTQPAAASNHSQPATDAAGHQFIMQPVHTVIVRQNDQLRLECETDLAKPHAEIIWLDQNQVQVERKNLSASGEEPANGDYYFESSIPEWDAKDSKLSRSRSTLVIPSVSRGLASKRFTCLVKHRAFDLENQVGDGFQLNRTFALDVHYPPEIELIKSASAAHEFRPFKITCKVNAKPATNLSYQWFIDSRLIEGANEAELRIERLTRQLHMRQIGCSAGNEIGSSSKELKLSILYAPAYITPLLPASLQPALPFPTAGELTSTGRLHSSQHGPAPKHSAQHQHHSAALRWPSEKQFALAKELAIAYEPNQEVELRCDFDSNPRLRNVSWYKIQTDYDIMQEISFQEADDLIAYGAAHAIFKPAADQPEPHLQPQAAELREHFHKRHIMNSLEPSIIDDQATREQVQPYPELDYEQMSLELIQALELWRNQPPNAKNFEVSQLTDLATLRQTNQQIHEPLSWQVGRVLEQSQQLRRIFVDNNSSQELRANYYVPERELIQLRLIRAGQHTRNATLMKRETQVSSSSIVFKTTSNDLNGKYVCKTESQDGQQRELAHAVFLVPKRGPRIISADNQMVAAESWAERRLQVDCLVQINTVLDTRISWFKNGKPIDSDGSRNVSVEYQRSPDLLFMRSILRLHNAQRSDLGFYNCTAENSLGPADSLIINLQEPESTGLIFIVGTSAAAGSVLILLIVMGLLVIFAPSKAQQKHEQHQNALKLSSSSVNQIGPDNLDSGKLDSESQEESQDEGIVCDGLTSSSMATNNHHLQQGSANYQLDGIINEQSVANSMMLKDQLSSNDRSQNGSIQQRRAASNSHHSKNVSTKFMAIHESLENSLQFNQAYPSSQNRTMSLANGEQQANDDSIQSPKSQAISEIIERRSLMNRIMAKLLMKDPKLVSSSSSTRTVSSRSLKARPTISMPIQQQQHGIKRSSLSTSLSMLSSQDTRSKNLLSSNANLIQDSTTASSNNSDNGAISAASGTSGSSRSSSSSANHHHLQNAQNEQVNMGAYQQQPAVYSLRQQPLNWMLQKQQHSPRLLMINEDSSGQYSSTSYMPAQDPSNLYSNAACMQQSWNNNNLPADGNNSNQHYQMPASQNLSEIPQENYQTCYAIACQNPYGTIQTIATDGSNLIQQPINVAEEGFYDRNYNTVLSNAYQAALNYNPTAHPMTQFQPQAANISTASSSPNSLTTQHATGSSINLISSSGPYLSTASQSNIDYNNSDQIAIVTTTSMNAAPNQHTTFNTITQMNADKGVATHV